jgi:dolichol kinase
MTAVETGLILFSISLLVGVIALVRLLGQTFAWSPELQRKSVHIATGLYALTLPLTFSRPWPVVLMMCIAITIMLVLRLPRTAASGLGATLHSVERKSFGDILLAVAVGFTFARSTNRPILFVLPVAILTLSDAAAALTGVRYGRNQFTVEAGVKSIEGSVMFFFVTLVLSMIALLLLTDAARLNVVVLALLLAAFATLIEADSWQGLDNLFVPVGAHLFLARHLGAPPTDLLGVVAVLIGLIVLFVITGRRLGLTVHAARSYAVLVFLILSVTHSHNALLPLAALAAQFVASKRRPCSSPFPNLDLLAAVALVSLFWLFMGEWHGLNAINMFNLTFAAVAAGLLSAAGLRTWPAGVAAWVVLGATVLALSAVNSPDTQWYGVLWPWVIVTVATAWMLPKLMGDAFDRGRSIRITAVALLFPVALFALGAITR